MEVYLVIHQDWEGAMIFSLWSTLQLAITEQNRLKHKYKQSLDKECWDIMTLNLNQEFE